MFLSHCFYSDFINSGGVLEEQLAALITALHRTAQRRLPVVLVGAGLPWTKVSSEVRFDRLTPAEKRYLRAMAELGPGPHRSGDIAEMLGRKVTTLGPTRNQLIAKGMIWSPNHGDTAFTVPLFDEFMKRIMSGEDWQLS